MLPRMRLLAFLGIVPLGVYVAHLVLTAAADIRLAVVCGGLAALAAVALAHGQHLALRLAGGTRLPCWMMPLAAGWLALAGSFVRSGSVQFRNPLGAHKYVLLAVWIVGVGAAAVSWALTLKRETVARRGLAAAVAALLCSMAAFPAIRLHDVHGDEPYYLWMTKSVVADGDLDLTNNVAPWLYERLEVFPRAAGRSELHSGYLPAYALLLVPGHALAGDGGAIATQMAISALLAAELYLLLTAAFGSANGWRAWVTVAATAPLATLAVHIYPETTAALLVTVTLRRLWQTPAAGPVATAVLIGALVWLHPRYAYLACGLAVMLLWRERAQWRRAAGALLALALLAAGAWLHRRGLTIWRKRHNTTER
ncbi:MAG TPA: hypothetical protein PKM88_12880, partial [bacterium]|nr:hypothetical protein [bacterium]